MTKSLYYLLVIGQFSRLMHGFSLSPTLQRPVFVGRGGWSSRPSRRGPVSSSSSIALELLGMDKALALPADQLSYEVQSAAKQLLVACVYQEVGGDSLDRAAVEEPNACLNKLLGACVDKAPAVLTGGGLLYLARLAAWVPQEQWARPLDAWDNATLPSSPEEQVSFLAMRLIMNALIHKQRLSIRSMTKNHRLVHTR